MKLKASDPIRWSGLAAAAAGILFIVIQAIHPADVLSSVTTSAWAVVHYLSVAMCLLSLVGLVGLYARQVEEAGWLGLAGYLFFSFFWIATMPLQFAEAFISPLLATEAPKFVEGFLGIISGAPSEVPLGALPVLFSLTGLCYLLGGLLFGIATYRASVLPRWAGGLLAAGAVVTLARAVIPHPFDRIMAVPMGLALVWLGYALWAERRAQLSQPAPGRGRPQILPTGAE